MANANSIVHIESDEAFNQHFATVKEKLLVIDFHATWCGPCKAIAPKFAQLSLLHPSVAFFKVDVDKCQMTSAKYKVSAMPTFLFIHRNEVKAKVQGADPILLENKLTELSQASLNQSMSSSDLVPGMLDLEQYVIEKHCLNESEEHPMKWVFEDNESLYLESDCDPELLMSFTFNQKVKLHSLKCIGPSGGSAPKTIKLFINQPSAMDFDSARDGLALQEIVLDEEEATSGDLIPLKFVKLQNVDNVTLFFPDNQGDEETTKINRLTFFGKSISTTNMGDFKRVTGKKGESH